MKIFSDKKKIIKIGMATLIIFLVLTIFLLTFFQPYPLKYQDEIIFIGSRYSVSPVLIASVINAESSFDKDAKSTSGAIGLMQVLPTTAEWLCGIMNKAYYKDILYNPYSNIEIGTYYLKYLIHIFGDTLTALASYNAGEGNVRLWLLNSKYSEDGEKLTTTPFKQTNAYIERVISGLEVYEKKFVLTKQASQFIWLLNQPYDRLAK